MARRNIQIGDRTGLDLGVVDSAQRADYSGMSWVDLRRIASERGVVSWRRKREQIIGDLLALDEQGGAT